MNKFILSMCLIYWTAFPTSAAELHWLTDFTKAQAQAQAENKMIFIYFTGSNWASNCLAFKQEVLATVAFSQYAEANLILLEVEFQRNSVLSPAQKKANQDLRERFNQRAFPTIILLNSNGEELGRHQGYTPGREPGRFLTMLRDWKEKGPHPPPPAATVTGPKLFTATKTSGAFDAADNPIIPKLLPEGTTKPAVLKGKAVSGDYAYADLESLLNLIGRIPNIQHEVLKLEFYKGFAAQVYVNGVYYNCVLAPQRQWHIVGGGSWAE